MNETTFETSRSYEDASRSYAVYARRPQGLWVKIGLVGNPDTPDEELDELVGRLVAEEAEALVSYHEKDREVRKGRAVVVYKGRKVAKGTKGIVRWIGEGNYGTRVGLAVEGEAKLVYTALDNVKVDDSPEAEAAEMDAQHDLALWMDGKREEKLAKGATDAERKATADAEAKASGIKKGDTVTLKDGSQVRVLWIGGTRRGTASLRVVPADAKARRSAIRNSYGSTSFSFTWDGKDRFVELAEVAR